jgi:hypothetical protein
MVFRWLRSRWNALRRQLDIAFLWPACKREAVDREDAEDAFLVHCYFDRNGAWNGLTHEEVRAIIAGLK